MNEHLNMQALAEMNARFAILSVGRYALAVRFRSRGSDVECQVPTWSGVGDLLEEPGEVTLVVVRETEAAPRGTESGLRWVFIRGLATVVPDPNWEGLEPPHCSRVSPDDLYQLIRVEPNRIELVDERRGWGFRETADL